MEWEFGEVGWGFSGWDGGLKGATQTSDQIGIFFNHQASPPTNNSNEALVGKAHPKV